MEGASYLNERPRGSLRALALKGMLWVGGGRLGTRIISQVFTIILARLLLPKDFGVLALASVLTGFLNIFTHMGLGSAIIQRKEVDEDHLSTSFWANLCAGVILFAAVAAASPLLGRFVKEPLAGAVAFVLAFRFLVAAGSLTQVAMITRRLDYRTLSFRLVAATIFGGLIGIGMAYAGMGVWSLVGQMLGTTAASTMFLYVATGWRPKWRFSWVRFLDLWSFGAPLFLSRLFGFLIRNVDNLLVGRYLGSVALGYYALGYTIFLAPLSDFGVMVNQVMFAALSRVQDQRTRLKQGFLMATEFATMAMLPMMVGLSLVATLLVEVLFGAKWLPSAPVISILALAGFLRLMTTLGPAGLQAAGRADLHLRWAFLSVVLYLPAFWIGLRGGIVGVAVGYLVATTILTPIQYQFVARVVDVSASEMWRAISTSVFGCAVMAGVVWPAKWALVVAGVPKIAALVLLVALGIVVYLGAIWVIQRQALLRFVRVIRESVLSRPGGVSGHAIALEQAETL